MVITHDGRMIYSRDAAQRLLCEHISPFDFEEFMLMAFGDEIDEAVFEAEEPKVIELEGIVDSYHSMGCEVLNLCEELQNSNKRISARDFAKQIEKLINEYM